MNLIHVTLMFFILCGCVSSQPPKNDENSKVEVVIGDSSISIPQLNKLISVDLEECALRKIDFIEKDSILTVKTCDTLYLFNKETLNLTPYSLRGKIIPWEDSLLIIDNKVVFTTYQCIYVLDSDNKVLYTEELFKSSIDEKINKVTIEEMLNGYEGITPMSGADFRVSIFHVEDDVIIFEYRYLVPQDAYSESYYDTLKLR